MNAIQAEPKHMPQDDTPTVESILSLWGHYLLRVRTWRIEPGGMHVHVCLRRPI